MSPSTAFKTTEAMVQNLSPGEPVLCLCPSQLAAQAKAFLTGFEGTTLYALKCNPLPEMVDILVDSGIRHFDTASENEIRQIRDSYPGAKCYFNHPVKSVPALKFAYNNKSNPVTDYVVDHENELEKIYRHLGTDLTIEVRLMAASSDAVYNFSTKFGAHPGEAASLLRKVRDAGSKPAISFHVGSQCLNPKAYVSAISLAGAVAREANVALEYINVGGGFPTEYTSDVKPLADYFAAIKHGAIQAGIDHIPRLCEPGRAMVGDSVSIVTQVHLRKDNMLYINDGIYGRLTETGNDKLIFPVRAIGHGRELAGKPVPFHVYGSTCDPDDVLKNQLTLPEDITEGDWIEIMKMGAYSNSIATNFNGFTGHSLAMIDSLPASHSAAASRAA